jgi:hypothetical protein
MLDLVRNFNLFEYKQFRNVGFGGGLRLKTAEKYG